MEFVESTKSHILGMLSFASILFILLALRNSKEDQNIGNWLKVLVAIPAIGMIPIFWLIYGEAVKLGVFCQYCTGAHLANLLTQTFTAARGLLIS